MSPVIVGRMRILQIAPVPREVGGVDTGGVATHAWGLATNLAALGHDVAVLAHNREYGEPWPERHDGVLVYGGRSYGGSRRLRALAGPSALTAVASAKRDLGTAWQLRWIASAVAACREAIEEFAPDVIHVHAVESRYTVARAANTAGVPLVATIHSTHYVEFAEGDVRDNNRALIERNFAHVSDVIFVSKWIADHHEEVFPGALEHANRVVLPNPIDAGEYHPVPRADARRRLGIGDERLLLTLGNLIPRKDPLTFVRAVGMLRDAGEPVRAAMVGEGPEKPAVRALIDELGLEDVIDLVGHVPQESINDYYTAADVYVFPSIMETWGLAAVEAMLCGTPVVGTFGVMPEVVPDFAGIYVPSHDPTDLAAGLSRALSRAWDRDAIRQFALGYDWKVQISGFEAFYRDAIGRRRT